MQQWSVPIAESCIKGIPSIAPDAVRLFYRPVKTVAARLWLDQYTALPVAGS